MSGFGFYFRRLEGKAEGDPTSYRTEYFARTESDIFGGPGSEGLETVLASLEPGIDTHAFAKDIKEMVTLVGDAALNGLDKEYFTMELQFDLFHGVRFFVRGLEPDVDFIFLTGTAFAREMVRRFGIELPKEPF